MSVQIIFGECILNIKFTVSEHRDYLIKGENGIQFRKEGRAPLFDVSITICSKMHNYKYINCMCALNKAQE